MDEEEESDDGRNSTSDSTWVAGQLARLSQSPNKGPEKPPPVPIQVGPSPIPESPPGQPDGISQEARHVERISASASETSSREDPEIQGLKEDIAKTSARALAAENERLALEADLAREERDLANRRSKSSSNIHMASYDDTSSIASSRDVRIRNNTQKMSELQEASQELSEATRKAEREKRKIERLRQRRAALTAQRQELDRKEAEALSEARRKQDEQKARQRAEEAAIEREIREQELEIQRTKARIQADLEKSQLTDPEPEQNFSEPPAYIPVPPSSQHSSSSHTSRTPNGSDDVSRLQTLRTRRIAMEQELLNAVQERKHELEMREIEHQRAAAARAELLKTQKLRAAEVKSERISAENDRFSMTRTVPPPLSPSLSPMSLENSSKALEKAIQATEAFLSHGSKPTVIPAPHPRPTPVVPQYPTNLFRPPSPHNPIVVSVIPMIRSHLEVSPLLFSARQETDAAIQSIPTVDAATNGLTSDIAALHDRIDQVLRGLARPDDPTAAAAVSQTDACIERLGCFCGNFMFCG